MADIFSSPAVQGQREKVRGLHTKMIEAATKAYDDETPENVMAFWKVYKEYNIEAAALHSNIGG